MRSYSEELKDFDGQTSQDVLEQNGIFLFAGEVDDDTTYDLMSWVLAENITRRHEQLTLVINSPGGEVTSGFGVVDCLTGSHVPIRTVGMGSLESMGLLIFIAGQKGQRILTPNTLIMSHQWSGICEGKEHELIAGVKRNNLISEMVIRHYRKHTGLPISKIKKYLLPPSDVYLTAEEALNLNLCDQIRLV